MYEIVIENILRRPLNEALVTVDLRGVLFYMSKISSKRIESMLAGMPKKEAVKPKSPSKSSYIKSLKKRGDVSKPSGFKPYQNKDLNYFINGYDEPKKLRKRKVKTIKTSLGERMVAEWLIKNAIRFRQEKEFNDLINPLTKQKLRFDFYLHSRKVCIEFDGKQHFETVARFDKNGDSFAGRQFRDSFKNEYCIKRGFKLIRIRYDEIKLIDSILTKYLLY